jgi:hypothetical protein
MKVLSICTVLCLAACSGPLESENPQAPAPSQAEVALQGQLREQLGRFARAVHQRDAATLEQILSSEVLARLETYPGGIDRFIEKDRAVLLDVFKTMDANLMQDRFTVSQLEVQGDVASVIPAYDGQSTEKRFYFVKEDGQYKVNVARPGFSRQLPEGSRPVMSTFRVNALVPIQGGEELGCPNDPTHRHFLEISEGLNWISCFDTCGFFDGTFIFGKGISVKEGLKCDWHWQGDDVFVDRGSDGVAFAVCRDKC